MLLELPHELLSVIYDKCYIEDRDNLNKALPKENRVKKKIDKKLHLLSYAMKRKEKNKFLSGEIYNFINNNLDDPTIKRYCEDIGITIDKVLVSQFYTLLNDLTENNIVNFDKYPIYTEVSKKELGEFTSKFYSCANATSFKKLYSNDNTRQILEKSVFKYLNLLIFNMFNYGNETLLKFLVEEGRSYEIIVIDLLDTVYDNLKTLSIRSHSRRLMLKYMDISQDRKNEMLEYVIDELDVEGFIDLIEAGAKFE
jgi:hypothetical protein